LEKIEFFTLLIICELIKKFGAYLKKLKKSTSSKKIAKTGLDHVGYSVFPIIFIYDQKVIKKLLEV
jgi:hypothetical protein